MRHSTGVIAAFAFDVFTNKYFAFGGWLKNQQRRGIIVLPYREKYSHFVIDYYLSQ